MTSKRIAQTNQQQKSEKAQGSGILQRAAVRSVSDAGVQSTDDQEELTLSNGAFSKDFSQVPISTNQPQQFQATKPQNYRVPPIQAKLTIGEPGDRYEQEADRVASEVVQRINAPSSTGESVQREVKPENEEELQMKSLADSIQRAEIDDEEELQMKTQVLRREAIGGGEASTDLESSINSARGGGQTMADNIRQPMEQAFGADFSGVKVHTDGQSDQLNRSIQARAFTTGQDVFFRSGEYNPGSRDGQELLAHELTHVVQQNGGAVQRSQSQAKANTPTDVSQGCNCGLCSVGASNSLSIQKKASLTKGVIQRTLLGNRVTSIEDQLSDLLNDTNDPNHDTYQGLYNSIDQQTHDYNAVTWLRLSGIQELNEIADTITIGGPRGNYYPNGFNSASIQNRNTVVANTLVAGTNTWTCPGVPPNRPPHNVSTSDVTIDHIIPVATHWNTIGHNSDRNTRNTWYNDTNNHEILCRSCNSSKGSGGVNYTAAPGPNFSPT